MELSVRALSDFERSAEKEITPVTEDKHSRADDSGLPKVRGSAGNEFTFPSGVLGFS